MCDIRLLRADEIDCRVQQVKKTESGGGCSLLLYKDARCDMAILDETFGGALYWKREHSFKNGKNYCTVSVWNPEIGQWISKEDIGTPSNTEENKGEASDAFKRACVNFGIGRELYTAPFIWIPLGNDEISEFKGTVRLSFGVKFHVTEVGYNEQREINILTITDNKGVVRYTLSPKGARSVAPKSEPKAATPAATTTKRDYDAEPEMGTQKDIELAIAIDAVRKSNTVDELKDTWNSAKYFHNTKSFIDATNKRKSEIQKL